ncbi:MAG: histidinol-phosphate transaminase [Candidatus Omnitrophota bacterium]|nr:histidinol-phosphate transaminase [Candidatus Omnitrophota bacterium]
MVNENILKINPYIPGKPIEEVKRKLKLKDVVKLASNESPFAPSKKVLQAINKAAKSLNRYPDGSCFYLRKKLAKKLRVLENQLIFGNGSDEIITMAMRAFVNPGDEVIIAKPTFLIYEIAAKLSGAKVVTVALKDFRYNLKAMKQAITSRTKIIFIANPDNPTGTYVTKDEAQNLLDGISKELIVYFDEAYYEIVTEKDYPDTLSLLKQGKNLIVTRTFSKAYSLAGLRIGYGISSKENIDFLNRPREPFNVNSLAQAAALASLDDKSNLLKLRMAVKEGKNYLYKNLEDLGLKYVPSVTNFILFEVGLDARRVCQELLKLGVIVREMAGWGMDNFIRVTIGRAAENKKFIKALKSVLNKK